MLLAGWHGWYGQRFAASALVLYEWLDYPAHEAAGRDVARVSTVSMAPCQDALHHAGGRVCTARLCARRLSEPGCGRARGLRPSRNRLAAHYHRLHPVREQLPRGARTPRLRGDTAAAAVQSDVVIVDGALVDAAGPATTVCEATTAHATVAAAKAASRSATSNAFLQLKGRAAIGTAAKLTALAHVKAACCIKQYAISTTMHKTTWGTSCLSHFTHDFTTVWPCFVNLSDTIPRPAVSS